MYSFRSIKGKIVFSSGLCLVVTILAVIAYSTTSSRTEALRTALGEATNQATIESLKVRSRFEVGLDAARGLSQTFLGIKEEWTEPSRDVLNGILRTVADGNDDLLGTWTVWESNALDGRDAEHVKYDEGHDQTGRFVPYWNKVGGLHLEPCSTYEDPQAGSWYFRPLNSGRETVLEPFAYEIGGKTVMVVSLAVPVRVDGTSIAVAGVDLAVDFLQTLADSIELFGEKADVVLVSHAATIAAHTGKPEQAGKALSEVFADADDVMRRIEGGKPFHDFADGRLRIVVPMTFGASGTYWAVSMSIREGVIYSVANAMAMRSTLIGGACVVGALIVLWFVAGVLARPIRETAHAVNGIAEGNLDVRLAPRGRDEVAVMQGAVNVMAGKLRENIAEIESQVMLAQEKTAQAESAMAEAEQAKARAERARAEGMLQAAEKLASVVERISTATEEISAQSDEIRKGTEVQRERISSTATAMEEMNATVLEVAQNAGNAAEQGSDARDKAQEGADVVERSIKAMTTTQRQAQQLRDNMAQLDEKAKAIGHIMTVIDDIADQTNLLALNAAIEAARAGDAGRGFAVVADEVRKLAEKTMTATKEVGDSIKAIQQVADSNVSSMELAVKDLDDAVDLANRSGEALKAIVVGTESSAGQIQGIATAAEEQSAASEEINHSIDEINRIAMDTARSVEESTEALRELAQQASDLSALIQELRDEAEM
ncbi:methyl-accepting chemotaxis protein [Desulfobaculum xiamenense]|uniref:Methyl-accepting chemotaxis protein n=1 Tax=Desulfobaculum xiamenense TaxID=995050 RepID=A0A846QLB4_9BACT|nr:methyl-accepting chemotaxis protein [Desulfobaculum xiamenense]